MGAIVIKITNRATPRQVATLELRFGIRPKMGYELVWMYGYETLVKWCQMLVDEGGRWVPIDYSVSCIEPVQQQKRELHPTYVEGYLR